jgi:cytochrome c oxidase subunit II
MSGRRNRQSTRKGRTAPKRKGRRAMYGILAGAVLLFASWLVARPFLGGGDGSDRGQVILVEADMQGFQPKVIRAKAGEPITIRLKSLDTRFHTDGGGKHQFAIDELGVDIIAPPLKSQKATFTVSEPGVYRYYCSICCGGKANPTMWGRLIVEA